MDAMESESEDSGFEKSIDDAGNDAEVKMGDLALAVAPAKPFSAKPKITKGNCPRAMQEHPGPVFLGGLYHN